MTTEEAIRILDPATTVEALVEIEYYGGFDGRNASAIAWDEACRIAVAALRAQQKVNMPAQNLYDVMDALKCLAYGHECRHSKDACPYYLDNEHLCDNISIAQHAVQLIGTLLEIKKNEPCEFCKECDNG